MSVSVRLNKHLAHVLGISRREADNWIERGRVQVNGTVASLGLVVQPERDQIICNNQPLTTETKQYTYLLMNKPVGYVCSRRQQGTIPTIYSLLPEKYHSLKVAGRLDKDSCGLLLLTDDGDTVFKLTHPKFGKEKVYHVALHRAVTPEDLEKINQGIMLEDGNSDMRVKPIRSDREANLYEVIMHEGRNRQIRRTFGGLGYTVIHLERISFGDYTLTELQGKRILQI